MMRGQVVNIPEAVQPRDGPCLYLGPGGERCSRPAVQDGFCVRHHPQTGQQMTQEWLRRVAAFLLLLAVLGPLLVDIAREVFRRLR